MSDEELKYLLSFPDVVYRRVATDELLLSFEAHAAFFFSAFHTDRELAGQIAASARHWLPALRDGYDDLSEPFVSPDHYTVFRDMAEQYGVFIREMNAYLARLDASTARQTRDALWYYFPGLRVDLRGMKVPPKQEEHRQLMVFVTGKCNLHCPYCFSKELVRSSLSRDDMTRVLAWAQRNGVRTLLPCGGEPLMYAHMDWLVSEVTKRGMQMYFATNLTVPLSAALLEHAAEVGQLHVHLTDEVLANERLKRVFCANLALCRQHGIEVLLRGNISPDTDHSLYDEWFRIADEYGIKGLNVAFTIPSHTGSNRFVHFDAMTPMIPYLQYIWEQGKRRHIRVSVAKPVPLCLLPPELAAEILQHNHHASFCNIGEDGGMHNLSLSNAMRFSPCLGVDEPSVPFSDEVEWSELRGLLGRAVTGLQQQPLFERCERCFLYHRRLCQGACLSYKQVTRNGGAGCGE